MRKNLCVVCLVLTVAPLIAAESVRHANGVLVATTTKLTASSNPAYGGQQITFTATVTAADNSVVNAGTVTFNFGTVTPPRTLNVVNGQAATQQNFQIGTWPVSVQYSGTANYTTSLDQLQMTDTCEPVTLNPLTSPAPARFGDPVNLTFAQPLSAYAPYYPYNGQLQISDDGQPLPGSLYGFNFIPLRTGTHILQASYGGDIFSRCSAVSPQVQMVVDPNGMSKIDLNGDGKADLVWRNMSTGQIGYWLLDGLHILASGNYATVPLSLAVAGFGDLNGDGKTDIIWRDANNGIGCWLMDGTNIIGGGYIGQTDPSLYIAGVGDLDGDGKADIVWRDARIGTGVGVWLMDGATIKQGHTLGDVDHTLEVAGVADINGDGHADILWWQPANRGTSALGVWFIGGPFLSAVYSGGFISSLPSSTYRVVGVGDFNGDGNQDLLLRDGNDLYVWFLKNGTLVETEFIGTVPPGFVICSTGDIDGDGKADIVFFVPSSGDVGAWLMNGQYIKAAGYIAGAPPNWIPQ